MFCELKRLFKLHIGIAKDILKWEKTLNANELFYIESIRTESNLVRALYCTILVFLIQISNVFVDRTTNAHPLYAIEYLSCNIFLMAVCIIYFFITLYFISKYKQDEELRKRKIVYLSFWLTMSVGTLLFCILDLMERESLINLILLLAGIAMIPILDRKELFGVLALVLAGQTAIIIILGESAFLLQQSIIGVVGAVIVGQLLFHSYTSSKIAQKRLKAYAQTDVLTGLPNRRGLEAWISRHKSSCMKQHCKVAVGIVDIDNFKEYNDELGHLEGDECLKYVADCIRMSLFKKAGIVSRFGGEEFVVILKDITEDEAMNKFEKIKSVIEKNKGEFVSYSITKNVTVSIGVAYEHINGDSNFIDIFKRADGALYTAKRKGKNLVVMD